MENYLLGTTEVVLNPMCTTIPEVRLEAYNDRTAWKANAREPTAHESVLKDSLQICRVNEGHKKHEELNIKQYLTPGP